MPSLGAGLGYFIMGISAIGVPPPTPTPSGAGYKVITVNGGNLWEIASRELLDATQAWRIAVLNGLSDPMLTTGLTTLLIPALDASQTDGIPPYSAIDQDAAATLAGLKALVPA